jgi:glycosyltransferase involved in cell wall biosynthesis
MLIDSWDAEHPGTPAAVGAIAHPPDVRTILHVNEKGGLFGGTEEYIATLTEHLNRQGVASHLLYEHAAGGLPPGLASSRQLAGLGERGFRGSLRQPLHRALDEIGPDVVYIHNVFSDEVIAALDRPDRHHAVIWYVHDHYLTCLTELRTRRSDGVRFDCRQPLGEQCLDHVASGGCVRRRPDESVTAVDLGARLQLLDALGRVDAVIVVSDFMRDVLVENEPDLADRTFVVPRQVRRPAHPDAAEPDRRVIAYAGRITPEKGLAHALDALRRAVFDRPVEMRIAGAIEDPRYWARCRELIDEVTAERPAITIRYLGHLAYDEVDEMMSAAHILVFPSLWAEPLGVVAAEAMLHGAAVVANDVGGIRTWFGAGCDDLVVDANDVQQFAARLGELVADDDLRRDAVRVGRARIAALNTSEAHSEALFDVVRRVQRQRTTPRTDGSSA